MDVEQSPAFLRELRVTARIQDARRFAQPPWQTALFVVLSFGLYLLPWSNRCWHYCNAAWEASGQSTRRSPWRRSLTFLIPIYGWLYAYYRLATDVREMVDADAEAALEPGALDTIFAGSLLACKLLPIPWAAVGIVGLLTCVLTVQLEINRTCARMQPGVMAHTRLNRQALVGIPLGLLLWAGFGYLVIQQYKLSSGVAALSFGHGLDSNGFTLLQPSSTFGSGDHVAWSVHLNGRIGEDTVRRTLDQRVGTRLVSVATDDLTVSNAGAHYLYEGGNSATFSGATLAAGTYEVRFWRDHSVIAEGTFTLTGSTAYVPDLHVNDGADFTGWPFSIAEGPDGNMYFTDKQSVDRMTPEGAITKYGLPNPDGQPLNIAADADGTVWFTEGQDGLIGRLLPDGRVSEQAIPWNQGRATDIAVGPLHSLWFTSAEASGLGVVNAPDGVARWASLGEEAYPVGVAVDTSDNVWAVENQTDEIARLDAAGELRAYPVLASNAGLSSIAAGLQGSMWFTEATANAIGYVTRDGRVTEFPLPVSLSGPQTIARGADGAMWFTERTGNRIGRITASGAISEFPIPTSASEPVGIASGPSGTIWFTEAAAHKIGVVTRNGVVREFSIAAPTPAVNSALARMSAASAYGPPGSRITVISLHIPGRAASTAVFSNPSYIGGMTLGPDGRPWFTEPSANIVATLQADGTVRLLPIKLPVNKCDCAEPTSDNLGGIVAGPDHNLWFTVDFEQVGKLTPSGKVTLYSLPTPDDVPSGLTAGSDGNLWFLDWADGGNGSYLARLTPQGQLTRMRAPSDLVTSGVANGPGKTMWFTGSGDSDLVERYDLSSHRFATFPMPTDESLPGTMLMGRDGRIWLAEPSANELAAISAQGSVAEYPLPSGGPGQASTEPNALVTGPDGHLWFLETAANRLCRVNSPGNVTEYALPPLGGNLAWTPGNLIVDRDGSFWYTVSGEAKDGGSGPGSAALVHVSLSRQHSSLGTTETARHS